MYAVAGVSGQTGAAVARALLDAGERLRVIVRRAEAGAQWKSRGAELAVADLTDAKALTTALSGTSGAYLLNPPRYDAADPFAIAARVGKAFAEAIEASGVRRVVVLSSVGGHLSAGTGVIATTHKVEQALVRLSAPLAILRARYFFENWKTVLAAVRESGVLPSFLAPVDRKIAMVALPDIASTVVALLRGAPWQGRRVIELASFEASPGEVADAFAAALGNSVAPVVVPREQWAGILAGNGFSSAAVAGLIAMYDAINAGVVAPEASAEPWSGTMSLQEAARVLLNN